jgi:hypothetical protein
VKVILKHNKMKLSISSISKVGFMYTLFKWKIDVDSEIELETFAKLLEEVQIPEALSLAETKWKVNQKNLNNFIRIIKNGGGVDFSPIQIDLGHE